MSRMSNYPNGFVNGITIRGVPLTVLHPGKVFYVNNSSVLSSTDDGVAGADTPSAGTYQRPFSTIDYAVGRCTAGRGDIIAVMPGHAETYSQATATADDLTLDVAGVAIVGLGSGSLRPTITQDTATTQNIAVTAANCMLYNLYIKSAVQDLAMSISLEATYFSLINCQFDDTSSALNFVNVIESAGSANVCDGLHVEDCVYNGLDLTFNTFCVMAAAQDDMKFIGNRMVTPSTTNSIPVMLDVTGIATHLWCTKNSVTQAATTNANVMVKTTTTASTGLLYDNFAAGLDTSGVIATVDGGYRFGNSHYGGVIITQSGNIGPAADT